MTRTTRRGERTRVVAVKELRVRLESGRTTVELPGPPVRQLVASIRTGRASVTQSARVKPPNATHARPVAKEGRRAEVRTSPGRPHKRGGGSLWESTNPGYGTVGYAGVGSGP